MDREFDAGRGDIMFQCFSELTTYMTERRDGFEGVRLMKRFITTCALLVAFAYPAFAAEHYAVVDTVGNCSVIDTKPSPLGVSGLKILGDKSGYPSPAAAEKTLKSDSSQCKGMIQRA
jgi:hypothetical protein